MKDISASLHYESIPQNQPISLGSYFQKGKPFLFIFGTFENGKSSERENKISISKSNKKANQLVYEESNCK